MELGIVQLKLRWDLGLGGVEYLYIKGKGVYSAEGHRGKNIIEKNSWTVFNIVLKGYITVHSSVSRLLANICLHYNIFFTLDNGHIMLHPMSL